MAAPIPLVVQLQEHGQPPLTCEVTNISRIGRDKACQIVVTDPSVSREHLILTPETDGWRISDPGSANGTWYNTNRIGHLLVTHDVSVTIGNAGTTLHFSLPDIVTPERPVSAGRQDQRRIERLIRRANEPGNERIQEVIRDYTHTSRRHLHVLVTLLVITVCGLSLMVLRQHRRLGAWHSQAAQVFYLLKSAEQAIGMLPPSPTRDRLTSSLDQSKLSYDALLEQDGTYHNYQTHEERLIVRMVRIFGECDVAVPVAFVREVQQYIQTWSTSSDPAHPERRRFDLALRTAEKYGYLPEMINELRARRLPPQFIYLAMQESNFDVRAVGPETRYGYAKGMWQFIPSTGRAMGLRTGPLVDEGVFDAYDERHDFSLSTRAAADYISYLYSSGTQSSGLLVMARYNWGETIVGRMIDRLPDQPSERNYWKLLEHFGDRVPKETRDYVFNIVAASVIGEDPRHFGFDRENPIQAILAHQNQPGTPEAEPPQQ